MTRRLHDYGGLVEQRSVDGSGRAQGALERGEELVALRAAKLAPKRRAR
jgi:hypothetical protein